MVGWWLWVGGWSGWVGVVLFVGFALCAVVCGVSGGWGSVVVLAGVKVGSSAGGGVVLACPFGGWWSGLAGWVGLGLLSSGRLVVGGWCLKKERRGGDGAEGAEEEEGWLECRGAVRGQWLAAPV